MTKDIAIKVEHLSKTFKVPHEKHTTLKSAAINVLSSRRYTEFIALDDISFEIKDGEFFGIIGRNGSGKSTLLKILAGIYVPDQGKIEIHGKLSPFLELGVGFNPELTARENVFLGGAILGLSRKEVAEKFDKIIKFAELEDFVDMKFKNFSSGMQVRLAFALAINAHAEILLMDEVLAVGDVNFQKKCLQEFRKYKEKGKTVVLVTHDVGVVRKYCDRAMLLKNGKIQKIGEIKEVTNEYAYQNLSDEESKSTSNNAKTPLDYLNKLEKEKESVKALNVECFSRGKAQKNFGRGDTIKIVATLQANLDIEDVIVGLSIDSSEGSHIIGPNTKSQNMKINLKKGSNKINLTLKNAQLNFGIYYITIGIFNEPETITYDFKKKIGSFKITTIDQTQDSPYKVDYDWSS
jgi:lipopolysaccharide transport system ATP-binding protein